MAVLSSSSGAEMRTTLRLKVWPGWFELWAGEEILLDGDIIEGQLVMP